MQVMIKALAMGVQIFLPLAVIGCGVCKYAAVTACSLAMAFDCHRLLALLKLEQL
jgi:hypothetical protein